MTSKDLKITGNKNKDTQTICQVQKNKDAIAAKSIQCVDVLLVSKVHTAKWFSGSSTQLKDFK